MISQTDSHNKESDIVDQALLYINNKISMLHIFDKYKYKSISRRPPGMSMRGRGSRQCWRTACGGLRRRRGGPAGPCSPAWGRAGVPGDSSPSASPPQSAGPESCLGEPTTLSEVKLTFTTDLFRVFTYFVNLLQIPLWVVSLYDERDLGWISSLGLHRLLLSLLLTDSLLVAGAVDPTPGKAQLQVGELLEEERVYCCRTNHRPSSFCNNNSFLSSLLIIIR